LISKGANPKFKRDQREWKGASTSFEYGDDEEDEDDEAAN
jgi:hypothetical protein